MTATAAPLPRSVRLRGRAYPLLLPSWRDPRLQLAAVITTLQVLGQTVLRFEVSVAQILLSLGVCLVVEAFYAFAVQRVVMWPASALLTGNSVAFIMRASGTRWGDWWSLRGWWVFVVAALLSLASKYLLRRRDGGHLFNPSNFGLLAAFVLFGTTQANPQDLWWGTMSPGLAATLAVIVVGGLLVAARLRMLGMVAGFWLTLAAMVAVLSAGGHCMSARWHVGAVCGQGFWSSVLFSPEILVFVFFMISDPRTAPRGQVSRLLYGVCIAALATLLMAPLQTEFATKVAVLDALVVTCALIPLLQRLARGVTRHGVLPPAAAFAAACGLVLAAGIPARTAAASNTAVALTAGARADAPPTSIAPPVQQADPDLTAAQARAMAAALQAQLPGRRLTAATVVLVRDPATPQAAPRLGLQVRGSTAAGGAFQAVYVLGDDGRYRPAGAS